MLHFTRPALVVFQNPTLPRVLKKMTNDQLELTLIAIKERKKRLRYLGSGFQHFADRFSMFNAQGNPRKGTRFILERNHNRVQFGHPGRYRNKVDIRSVKMGGSQFDQMGNYTRSTWDQGVWSTNVMNDPTFKKMFRGMEKDQAISMLEEWGVRYVLLDEIRKPSLVDCKYYKHQLFADKFSWSPDPETNYFRGDAEYKWKGTEQIEYDDYNAHVQHPDNFATPTASKGVAKKTTLHPSPWFTATIGKHAAAATTIKPSAPKGSTASASK